MRLVRPKFLLLLVLSALGAIAAARNLSAMTGPVETTPLAVLTEPSDAPAGHDLASYLALTRYHYFEMRLRGRDDTPLRFIAYVLATTRATARQCATHGIAVDEAMTRFADEHRDLYADAADVLAADGLNAERVWNLLQPVIEDLAAKHLDQLADRYGGDRRDACRWIADHPLGYAAARRYETHYPRLYRMLVR